jgi:hypothetical protein
MLRESAYELMKVNVVPRGWMARDVLGRPRMRCFTFLAVLWAAVAFIGVWLLSQGEIAAHDSGIRRLAWLILLPEPVFVGLAVFFRLTERPRRIPVPPDWEGPVLH